MSQDLTPLRKLRESSFAGRRTQEKTSSMAPLAASVIPSMAPAVDAATRISTSAAQQVRAIAEGAVKGA